MELEIQKDYLDNLKKQSELQNIVYDDINNDQKILNDLYNHAKETNTLFQENKRLMNLLIARLNEPINNEEFLELQSFANTLTDFFMSKDAEFAFLIHSKLLEVAKKNKDLNLTVEELYYNFKCAYSISRVYGTNLYEHLYDNLDYYIAHYFELDKKNRELFLKFYANQTISIKEPENNYYKESIDVALNYINFARRKDVREKDPDFHFALFEQTVKRNIAKYITLMVQNIKIDEKYQKVIFDAVESTYNDYKNKSEMMKFPSPELEAYRYQILRYLRNEITFKDLLDFVNGLVIKYQDSDETLKSISSAFHYRAILVVLVKNYAKMDENEKRTFIDQIVKDALIYLKHLKKTEFVNYAYKGYFDLVCAVSFFEDGSHASDLYLNLIKIQDMPTYVHSLGVAKISRILASTLLESNPEQFIGINNSYPTLDEVIKNKEEIKDLIYRGALLHDVGKTPLVDIISNCYRPLTDKEFDLIRQHPNYSVSLLSNTFGSLIQDVALYHHLYHNHLGGYPHVDIDFKTVNQTPIDILSVADTLEAATDNIGRTYKKFKSLEDVISEMKSYPSDTRYSSLFLSALDKNTIDKINEYLIIERPKIFCNSLRETQNNDLIDLSKINVA